MTAAPTAMVAALLQKMAKPRDGGKCRMSLVSIAAGYGLAETHTEPSPGRLQDDGSPVRPTA
jgi:hypothetical protein